MIGLVVGRGPAAGVIHAPVSGVAWIGGPGLGAWRMDPRGAWVPIRVSATGKLTQARLVASRSHRSARLERTLATLAAREVRSTGSAGLKGAQVAQGLAEAYVDPGGGLKRWDVCAVCERGFVASNGLTHEAILSRLARARR